MEKIKLYLCNGKACSSNPNKIPNVCYINGGECQHTSDKKYAKNLLFGFYKFKDSPGGFSIEINEKLENTRS